MGPTDVTASGDAAVMLVTEKTAAVYGCYRVNDLLASGQPGNFQGRHVHMYVKCPVGWQGCADVSEVF